MGFESGSISFRVFSMPRPMPDDAIERFAELSIPPLETISESALYGWVTGRHLFDTDIREETALYGGWLRMALLQLEKKVPASLMQAEMKREELVRCAADDKPFINRRERTEIKEELLARLLPSMPPSLKGYPLVCRPDGTRIFASALADKQADILVLHLRHALGIAPLPFDPATAAFDRKQVDARSWGPASFSENVSPEEVHHEPGSDFLTWLWFRAETGKGYVEDSAGTRWGLLFEGPLQFVREGAGAHETILRKGVPTASPEAGACLRAGKKLTKAKVSMTYADQAVWEFQIDADTFAFRSMKVPESDDEVLDPVSRFQDRLIKIEQVVDGWYGLYDVFVDERRNPKKWSQTLADMRAWTGRNRGGQ